MSPEDIQRLMAEHARQQQEAILRGQGPAHSMYDQPMYTQPRQQYHIIAAIEKHHGGFSYKGDIPWYYKEDFQHFRELTTDHICVMGRKTYEDINKRLGDKAKNSVLPNRQCFVVSKSLTDLPNATVIPNIRHVEFYTSDTDKPIFIIGGRRLFIEGMAFASTIHLTLIDKKIECDLFFPIKNLFKNFGVASVVEVETAPELRFATFIRK